MNRFRIGMTATECDDYTTIKYKAKSTKYWMGIVIFYSPTVLFKKISN